MTHSVKSLMLLSSSAVAYTTYTILFSPKCLVLYNYLVAPYNLVAPMVAPHLLELEVSLVNVVRRANGGCASLGAFLADNLTESQIAQISQGNAAVTALSQIAVYLGFSAVLFILVAPAIDMCGLSSSVSSIRGALASAVTPNLNFMRGSESVLLLLFLFLSLYFLEVHFFFIFTLGLSSDSLVYQFNFLLSSFLFIFLFKFWSGLATDSMFFSVAPLFSSYLFFSQGRTFSGSGLQQSGGGSYSAAGLVSAAAFSVSATFVSLFFFVTFIVWVLRYVIQFMSLLVLFMMHTVFEFAMVSNDSYFSSFNQFGFFFFKSFFFIFFYFWGFLYLLVYLNLMFTLQAFIFFFFSEVFQANFLFDLSAVVSSKLSYLKDS